MKKYELMTIYNVELGDAGAKELSAKVAEVIKSLKGNILKTDFWGKRKFAYEIKKASEGYYDIISFEMESSEIKKFKTKLNLVNGLVRYLITAQK